MWLTFLFVCLSPQAFNMYGERIDGMKEKTNMVHGNQN